MGGSERGGGEGREREEREGGRERERERPEQWQEDQARPTHYPTCPDEQATPLRPVCLSLPSRKHRCHPVSGFRVQGLGKRAVRVLY